jgi:hypothetical protein
MTQPTNKEKPKTDDLTISIMATAIQDFNSLSPIQRREVRQSLRRWFVAGGANAIRPAENDLAFETAYDNLDFQGG